MKINYTPIKLRSINNLLKKLNRFNTIEFKASSGSTTIVSFLKKDWFINASGNVYTYELLDDGTCSQTKTITLPTPYYMEPFKGVLWNRSNQWLVYDTIPTSDNIKEIQVTGFPYRDRIILGYCCNASLTLLTPSRIFFAPVGQI